VATVKYAASVFLFLLSVCGTAFSQTRHTIEITRVDFTKEEKIISTSLTVFGIGLGDSLTDTKVKAERAGVKLTMTEGRYSLFDGDDELVGIGFESEKVVMLALFHGMVKHLAGDSAQLLGDDTTSPDSAVRMHLLGREDKRTVEHGSTGMVVTCSYDKEGIHLIRSYSRYGDAPTVLHLVLPARTR